ncbi:hypothetical protein BGZ70_003410, partial [Mortierella alpina]
DPPHKYEKGNRYVDSWSASSASHDVDQNQESSYNADNGTDHGIEEEDDEAESDEAEEQPDVVEAVLDDVNFDQRLEKSSVVKPCLPKANGTKE